MLERTLYIVNASLELQWYRWTSLLLLFFLTSSLAIDARQKMWNDELITLAVAKQRNLAEIVQAVKEGCDGAPPAYAMAVHVFLLVVPNEALAVRLPSTLGFLLMLPCLLVLSRRYLPASYAFAVALFAWHICRYYATEGRSYGVVLGCGAASLLCWRLAFIKKPPRIAAILLALTLGIMVAMHYYAVFFVGPLFIAELMRVRNSRRWNIPVFAAMLVPLFVMTIHYPLIAASSRGAAHFWSRPSFSMVPSFYYAYLIPLLYIGCPLALAVSFALPNRASRPHPLKSSLPVHEWVLAISLTGAPVLVIILSKYTTHAFVSRYALWGLIGICFLVVAALSAAVHQNVATGVVLSLLLLGLIIKNQTATYRIAPHLRDGEDALQALESLPLSSDPIVVGNPHVFMELSYYAPVRIRERVVYLFNNSLDLKYYKSNSDPLILQALRFRSPLAIRDYEDFLRNTRRFVLAAIPYDYLPWHLVGSGHRVAPLRDQSPPLIFMVSGK